MSKEDARNQLKRLIDRYNASVRKQNRRDVSEETVRTWLNEMLGIFGWNVQDTSQVLQERVLNEELKRKLKSIDSAHTRPDYILKNGLNIKTFLDAKSLDVNIFADKEAAFQIRSYGWSANVPCAFISNFEQLSIYETKGAPVAHDAANKYALYQFSVDDYLDNFDVLYEHLNHDFVCSNHLESLYEDADLQGTSPLDESFATVLHKFRLAVAKEIFANNTELITTSERLNYYTQVVIDRIVFIRVCEAKGIERAGLLKSFCEDKKGFWNCFKASCYMEFYNHYDGALFDRDALFDKLKVSDGILADFIEQLYYPYPFKFDIIPVKLIAKVYEKFLETRLVIRDGAVSHEIKPEYVKTNGAIPTPEHIVDMVCKQTLKLSTTSSVEDLLRVKILDPCCGSAVFLVSCYELLAERFLHIVKNSGADAVRYKDWFISENGYFFVTLEGRRNLITHCLYGIDCDDVAVEVAKMALALKVVDGTESLYWEKLGAYGERLLRDISENIKLGNTLVSEQSGFSPDDIEKTKPLNATRVFKDVFANDGGFLYIVGNPPYVETKFYKADNPVMHRYLSRRYKSFEKKADLAVLFMERSLELLCKSGRAGFVIQKRWFKAEYGRTIRNIICGNGYLDTLLDFSANDLFKGKQTYVAILILEKDRKTEFNYQLFDAGREDVKRIFENADFAGNIAGAFFTPLAMPQKNTVWSFENNEITILRDRLAEKFGTLETFPGLAIHDGIQALWKKAYHLKDVLFDDEIAVGLNGFNEKVRIEKNILRGVIYNREFYPFKNLMPDAFCIFPYHGASNDEIPIDELKSDYPLAYRYFLEHEDLIKANVECPASKAWYAFTREHNHTLYDVPKIILPMTARDTIATYVSDKGLYMDNANVWFITVSGADDALMKALTCLMNSTVFSVLAKSGANPQLNGYYKLNKQFLRPIPVPAKKIQDAENIKKLSACYDEIAEMQKKYLSAVGEKRKTLAAILEEKWDSLDDFCNALYELTEEDVSLVNAMGRTSRVVLLK